MQADLLKWIKSYEPDLIRCRLQASDKNVESKDIKRGITNSLENEIGLSRRVIAYFSNPYQKNLADRLTTEIEKVNDIGSFDARQKNITIYYLPTILEINSALDDCLAAIPCQQAKSLTNHSGDKADLRNEKPAETSRDGTPAKEKNQASVINIQNFEGILGNVQQVENLQIGDSVSMNNQPQIEKKGMVKKIIELIFKKILDHIIAIIATFTITALVGILHYFEQIKAFIYNVLSQATK